MYNQLYAHKMYSPDFTKSPTCFGQSQVPSSGSPLSSPSSPRNGIISMALPSSVTQS